MDYEWLKLQNTAVEHHKIPGNIEKVIVSYWYLAASPSSSYVL